MPIEKLKYCCNLCKQEFIEYDSAVACENKGIPTEGLEQQLNNINIGDILTFEAEDGGMGSHYSYYQDGGKVLAKFLASSQERHHWFIIVKTKYCERAVFVVQDNNNFIKLMSPHEYCYKEGYAELIRNNNPEFNVVTPEILMAAYADITDKEIEELMSNTTPAPTDDNIVEDKDTPKG